ncbi:MAG: nitroreductase [Gemmatimonadetes bacterium]|nr:nitroreductase [Gemmatimonadota bacterium]NIR77059.1 nitroreductase [Gemmatimonadota bacterium]NIT85579.1 nitroreductase [Gemmatimonadota bacterium]NIU29411.1 nitroreductase [Gemmatimonadota bacterium]NIU34476.1 nitroreductase [Gemmatimonadota bacterium]
MSDRSKEMWSVDSDAFPSDGSREDQAAFLLRYAVLAPSSHNSQPWAFRVRDGTVDVYADPSRWLRVADADRRELYLSVGCAVENLVVAAEAFGFEPEVRFEPGGSDGELVARVALGSPGTSVDRSRPPGLFDAIPRRQTNHGEFDGRPIPPAVRTGLEGLALEPGITVRFTDDPAVRREVDELTARADALQFADPRWRKELGEWLGRGVFGHGWLMSKAAQLAVSHLNLARSQSRKDTELLRSASLLGLVDVEAVDRESRVRAGQVFERLFLAATDAGLALQPMNQILQVEETRDEFEALLPGDWGRPQITFRLGYGESEEHTPRRPLEEVVR